MVSEPEHAKDRQGANIALVCEAEGYPIPNVEWTWTTVDGDTVYLPSTYRSQISELGVGGLPRTWNLLITSFFFRDFK